MDKGIILEEVRRFYKEKHVKVPYQPGDRINYAGRVYDEEELCNLVDAALDFWLTAGSYTEQFEQGLAAYLGVPFCSLVNSGSSANLLAVTALTSPLLGSKRLCRGDEVITVVASFPTTVTPIVQCGAVPVFVDIQLPDCNIDPTQLELARSERTKAVILAHTLGSPFNIELVKEFCDRYGLWLIEDNCDALGAEYYLDGVWRKTGTIGGYRHIQFLSGPSYHHGRGRRDLYQQPIAP